MKKIYLLLTFILCCHTICAQQVVWERTYGTTTTDIKRCALMPDGGFALLLMDGLNVSISRLDSAGIEMWNEPLGSNAYIDINCFIKAVPGGILAGMMDVSQSDTLLPLLVKFDLQGTELWRKKLYTGRTYNQMSDLYIRSANEYILLSSGHNLSQPGGGAKFITFSVDSTGGVNWRQNYFEDSISYCYPRDIIPYRKNGYLFCGQMGVNGHHPYIIKTGKEGLMLQYKMIDDVPNPPYYSVVAGNYVPLSGRSIAFTGFNFVNDYSQRYILISKADTALNVLWTVTHAEPGGNLESSRVIEMADSTFLLVTQKHNNNKIILLKISPQGELLDTTYITTSHATYANSLLDIYLLPDSSLIYAFSGFLAKIKNIGLPMVLPPDTGTVSTSPLLLPSRLRLGDAFPNPASGFVTVPYELPKKTTSAVLELRELVTGRLIRSYKLAPESTELKVELDPLSDGLYTYSLFVNGNLAGTKKLVVIK